MPLSSQRGLVDGRREADAFELADFFVVDRFGDFFVLFFVRVPDFAAGFVVPVVPVAPMFDDTRDECLAR